MAISSLSLTYFSMVGSPSANAPVGGAAPAANDTAVTKKLACEDHEPRRRNVLFEAMMSALRELGLAKPAAADGGATTGAPAAPATSTPSAAATPAASTGPTGAAPASATAAAPAAAPAAGPAPSLEDAVLSFAHALWQALRGDEGSGRRRDHDDGDGHRHHHHHHHRRHERDYAGLASRIEALAVRIESNATGAAPGATSPSVTSPIATSPKLPGVEPVQMDAVAPASTATAATPDAGAPATSSPDSTVPAVPAKPTKGSLAESFAAMLKLLRGGDQPAGAPAPDVSLASFLHSLARGLDADRSAPSMTVVGVMINVSA